MKKDFYIEVLVLNESDCKIARICVPIGDVQRRHLEEDFGLDFNQKYNFSYYCRIKSKAVNRE